MDTTFRITEIDEKDNIKFLPFPRRKISYEEAEEIIKTKLPPGTYQIQKVFIKTINH